MRRSALVCICGGASSPTQGLSRNRVIDRHVEVQVLSDVMIHVTHHLSHSCTTKIPTNTFEPPPPTSRLCMVCAFAAQNTFPISTCPEAGWLGWVGWICVNTCVVITHISTRTRAHTHTHTHARTYTEDKAQTQPDPTQLHPNLNRRTGLE